MKESKSITTIEMKNWGDVRITVESDKCKDDETQWYHIPKYLWLENYTIEMKCFVTTTPEQRRQYIMEMSSVFNITPYDSNFISLNTYMWPEYDHIFDVTAWLDNEFDTCEYGNGMLEPYDDE